MKIVIEIPDNMLDELQRGFMQSGYLNLLFNAVKSGVILPKDHGDLIDADEIVYSIALSSEKWTLGNRIENTSQIIIPADKEGTT